MTSFTTEEKENKSANFPVKYQLTLEISRGFFISGRPGTKSPGPSRLSKFRLRFAVAKLHLLVADGVNQEVKSSHFPRGECSYAWSNPWFSGRESTTGKMMVKWWKCRKHHGKMMDKWQMMCFLNNITYAWKTVGIDWKINEEMTKWRMMTH